MSEESDGESSANQRRTAEADLSPATAFELLAHETRVAVLETLRGQFVDKTDRGYECRLPGGNLSARFYQGALRRRCRTKESRLQEVALSVRVTSSLCSAIRV